MIDKFKFFLKKKYASPILIIFIIQLSLADRSKPCMHNSQMLSQQTLFNNNYFLNNSYTTMYIESDEAEISYPNKTIQLSGNVLLKQNQNIITSDKLIILNNKDKHLSYSKIHAYGNVCYRNHYFKLKGSTAQFDLNNNNINIYQGEYHLHKFHAYGTANTIMQRKNNRYTIIKNGNFIACISNNNYWNITGSTILYDHHKKNIDIWQAYLKINTIPILYIPYLSFSINQKNILDYYIPQIKYSNQYGLGVHIPFPLNFSKYYLGNISPYYQSNFGIGLNTKINYSINPGIGLINFNIIENNKKNNNFQLNKFYTLHWQHNGIINNKWHVDINYLLNNNSNYFKTTDEKYINFCNNYNIDKKFLFFYSDAYWKSSIAYLGYSNTSINKNQNNCVYSVKPQLECYFYYNLNQTKLFNFQIFNQFSKFIPSNRTYPESIRIHIEPMINFSTYHHWINIDTESKLKITYYQQKNIQNYNNNQYPKLLNNTINRIIPQFKITGKTKLQKKTKSTSKYKHFLEPKIQYLYTPYRFQENIGIYDTKFIYINHDNLFHDNIYTGLDRIAPTNQIIGNLLIRFFYKQHELFYTSIGSIFNLVQYNIINNPNKTQRLHHNNHAKIKLFSGMGHWNINNYWNINSEILYNTLSHQLSYGNIVLEYQGKHDQILQINYRYINSNYFQENSFNNILNIHETISQFGVVSYLPLINNWRLSYSHYHNVKVNYLIDQVIGIQHVTPCWIFNIIFERKIIDWNKKLHTNIYDNILRLNFNLYNTKLNFKSDLYKILNANMIPYQGIF